MKMKELPWFNRPGYKLEKNGAGSLDSAELLAIILGYGSKKESVLELSNRLLKKHNLHNFENLGFRELVEDVSSKKDEYVGSKVKAMKIFALVELAKRYNKLKNKGFKRSISSAKDVYDLLVDRFGSLKKEHFVCLYLDTKNNIIKEEVVSVGTLNSSLVHPREVFVSAIRERANSIILVHNHPSGSCEPSVEDEKITSIFRDGGELLGIRLLDHVVISKKEFYSFKERGRIIG
jgi:DNA repair protein RadC